MVRSIVVVGALLLCTACTKTEDYLRDMVTKHSNLVDPGSTMFRKLTHKRFVGETWCGELNAKNRMGGYVGWSRFTIQVYDSGKPHVFIVDDNDSAVDKAVANLQESFCSEAETAPSWVVPMFHLAKG